MSFHFPFFRKPEPVPNHVVIRYVAATKAEDSEAKDRRDLIRKQLQSLHDSLRPEELSAAISRGCKRKGVE